MKSIIIISTALLLSILFSCKQKKEDKSFLVFNEGVALNLKFISEQEKGNFESALSLNKQSIGKFKETLKIDSSHPGARISLGHSILAPVFRPQSSNSNEIYFGSLVL